MPSRWGATLPALTRNNGRSRISNLRGATKAPGSGRQVSAVDYDESGAVIGMVLVNVRFILERDGMLTLSLPPEHLAAAALQPVLVAA